MHVRSQLKQYAVDQLWNDPVWTLQSKSRALDQKSRSRALDLFYVEEEDYFSCNAIAPHAIGTSCDRTQKDRFGIDQFRTKPCMEINRVHVSMHIRYLTVDDVCFDGDLILFLG